MIQNDDFESMREEFQARDAERETLIKGSRDVLKLSKQIIYAIHRNELEKAESLIESIKTSLSALNSQVKDIPGLYYEGSYKVAVQEYVEAVLFYAVVKDKKILTRKELNVNTDYYLLGICDLPGELVRKAIVDATKGNTAQVTEFRELVDQIYGIMSTFDIRSGELRKKFDSIKYDLRKLDDLCFELRDKS